jgi:hypothetical protein
MENKAHESNKKVVEVIKQKADEHSVQSGVPHVVALDTADPGKLYVMSAIAAVTFGDKVRIIYSGGYAGNA